MKSFLLILMVLAAAPLVNAAEMREIELTDGSIIAGEIVSLSGGVYTIRSATLGAVQVEESKVRTIRAKGSAGSAGDIGGQVKSLQDAMMSDAEIMNLLQSLQNDPDFQAILQDPVLMNAVQAGDIATVLANPQIMKLLNSRAVQQIKNKIPITGTGATEPRSQFPPP